MLQVIKSFEEATGEKVPYEIAPRRIGDVPSIYSTAALVRTELGWKANLNMHDMCKCKKAHNACIIQMQFITMHTYANV